MVAIAPRGSSGSAVTETESTRMRGSQRAQGLGDRLLISRWVETVLGSKR